MTKARQIAMPMWLYALILVLGGCANDRPKDLPGNAVQQAEGNGKVTWTAPQRGTAYVYDNNNEHLIWSGQVHKGDAIVVDPEQDRVMVGDQKVTEKALTRGREHRIFFVPSANNMSGSSSSMTDTRDSDRATMSSDHDTVSGSVHTSGSSSRD
jgi:hypothetical protein